MGYLVDMEEEEIQEKIDDGWIRANVIFEVVGNPKSHVEDSLKSYIENIKTDEQLRVLSEDFGEPEQVEEGLFSTFADTEILIEDLNKLNWLCYNFSPASVEIMEPVDFHFKAPELQDWINDFLSKLHEVGQMSKQMNSRNKLLMKNFNRLVKNSILICVQNGYETPAEIEEQIGIDSDNLREYFQALIDEGKLTVDDNQYEKVD